jgi:hypothetical protein
LSILQKEKERKSFFFELKVDEDGDDVPTLKTFFHLVKLFFHQTFAENVAFITIVIVIVTFWKKLNRRTFQATLASNRHCKFGLNFQLNFFIMFIKHLNIFRTLLLNYIASKVDPVKDELKANGFNEFRQNNVKTLG